VRASCVFRLRFERFWLFADIRQREPGKCQTDTFRHFASDILAISCCRMSARHRASCLVSSSVDAISASSPRLPCSAPFEAPWQRGQGLFCVHKKAPAISGRGLRTIEAIISYSRLSHWRRGECDVDALSTKRDAGELTSRNGDSRYRVSLRGDRSKR